MKKGNDTCTTRLIKCRAETSRQLKMPQVVRRKLRLVSSTIASQRRRHNASVIDQHVQRPIAGEEFIRKSIDGNWIEQVQRALLHAWDAAERLACLVRVTSRHDHRRAGFSESTCCFQANAGVSTGDYGNFAVEIDAFERLSGTGRRSKTGVDRCLFAAHLCFRSPFSFELCLIRSAPSGPTTPSSTAPGSTSRPEIDVEATLFASRFCFSPICWRDGGDEGWRAVEASAQRQVQVDAVREPGIAHFDHLDLTQNLCGLKLEQ